MRIAQISDIHISADGELVDGVDVRETFSWALAEAERSSADLLVLSGDLAQNPEDAAVYPWIAEQTRQVSMPVMVLSGNHDEPRALARAFGIEHRYRGGVLLAKQRIGDVVAFGLDTTTAFLSDCQLAWLRQQIESTPGTPIVFLHHPPIPCGCVFMDTHAPLLESERVWSQLSSIDRLTHVFCGHYHTYKVVERDGIQVVLCPSTLIQISQQQTVFTIEHTTPGYIEIDVTGSDIDWRAIYRPHG